MRTRLAMNTLSGIVRFISHCDSFPVYSISLHDFYHLPHHSKIKETHTNSLRLPGKPPSTDCAVQLQKTLHPPPFLNLLHKTQDHQKKKSKCSSHSDSLLYSERALVLLLLPQSINLNSKPAPLQRFVDPSSVHITEVFTAVNLNHHHFG